ncbi:MAG: hypothetical protein KDI09_17590, partial [Halioglobus sp.]|nr:hypothetical protein [Halioglobus sp.]
MVAAAETWLNPFAAGDPNGYPQPQPVDSVARAANLKPHPSLAALTPDAAALEQGGNTGARIELLQMLRSDEIAGVRAPAGMEAIILVTRWENVHPRQSIERAQLEGSADRTSGAGALFGGGSNANPKDMVELDVAYKVQQPGRHLWLVAAGETHALRIESGALPNGF